MESLAAVIIGVTAVICGALFYEKSSIDRAANIGCIILFIVGLICILWGSLAALV